MSYLSDDIAMAAVNEAKVVNIDDSVKEAQSLLTSHLLDSAHVTVIKNALDTIKQTQDYELQPELVQHIDKNINDVGNVMISRGGDVELVSGTESFGLTLSPKEWRRTRVEGCESLLDELTKNIKGYASKLAEKLSEVFSGNKLNIDSLVERLEEANKKLLFIEHRRDDVEFVNIPEIIVKTLTDGSDRQIVTNPNIDKILNNELNLAVMCVKFWSDDSTKYKNKVIKFFGNKGRGDFRDLIWTHPKFTAKKSYIDEDNSNEVTWTTPGRLLGNAGIFFTEIQGDYESLAEVAGRFPGYRVVTEYNSGRPIQAINIKPLSITQLETISKTVGSCIETMKLISSSDNSFDISARDIKDILNSLKDKGDTVLMDSFSGIIANYQSNTIHAQAEWVKYFGQVASHLITFMFINMEGYDDA